MDKMLNHIFHRCEKCFYAVKTSAEFVQKQIVCPYDGEDMHHHYVENMSIFSNLAEWEESGREGYYSLALGRVVESKNEEEVIMEQRGFIKESKLKKAQEKDWYDKWWKAQNAKEEEIARLTAIYHEGLAKGLTKEEAITKAFTAEDALSGKLDTLFKNGE
jgi:hypothetical protein